MRIRAKWIILFGVLIIIGVMNLKVNISVPMLGKNYDFNSDNIDKEAVKEHVKDSVDIIADAVVPEDSSGGQEIWGYLQEAFQKLGEVVGSVITSFSSSEYTMNSNAAVSSESVVQKPEPQIMESIPAENGTVKLTPCTVLYVIDGDTFKASFGAGASEVKIRLIGIDTPESVHSDVSKNNEYGVMASDYTKSILQEGQTVYVEYDNEMTDKYGRTLSYVWLSEDTNVLYNMLNARLVAEGYAYDKVYAPNDKYADVFHTLRISSQEAGNGLWKYQGFIKLWE